MKVLILGSRGFIGSHLIDYYTALNYTVTGCDLVENAADNYTYHKLSILSSDFESLFASNTFDVCINASGSGNVGYSMSNPTSDFDSNTNCVIKILDAIRKHQPQCRLLHISSAAVYGNPVQLPISESAIPRPVSPYGFHKQMSELLCREYAEIYNIPIIIIRPFSVFGNGLKKQLLWDICQKLSHSNTIELFGTGNETRDFIHISSLVKLVHYLTEKVAFDGSIFNAACGIETNIKTVAGIFEKHFPGNKQIRFTGNSKEGDPVNWQADISKIQSVGFAFQQNLEQLVKEYINWFCILQAKPISK